MLQALKILNRKFRSECSQWAETGLLHRLTACHPGAMTSDQVGRTMWMPHTEWL